LPLLAKDTFHQHSASAYGLMMAALGLGAILGGLYIAWKSKPTPKMLAVLSCGFAASITALTFAPTLLAAQLLLIPTGLFMIAFMSSSNATLQMHSSQEMRGRVMSLYGISFLGTTPIGSPLVGLIISWTNARMGIAVGALSAVVTAMGLLWALRLKNRPSSAA
jgi:MFS family permease